MESRNPGATPTPTGDTPSQQPAPVNASSFYALTDGQYGRSQNILFKYEQPGRTVGEVADEAAKIAKGAAFASLPVVTAMGIEMMRSKDSFGILPVLGVPVTIGGIVIDTVKAPICLAIATEEGLRAGITKLVSLVFNGSPVKEETRRIFKSFLLRMQQTATILEALGLADKDVLDRKFKSGDIEELVGLTLLHTAYASRHSFGGGIVLANKKVLSRSNCPPEGLALYDKICEMRGAIVTALSLAGISRNLSTEQTEIEESRVVCQWIRLVVAGKTISAANKSDATPQQIEMVNKIIAMIDDLKKEGLRLMPESATSVGKRVSRLG